MAQPLVWFVLQAKIVRSTRKAAEGDLELFNRVKQQKLNELGVVVSLRLREGGGVRCVCVSQSRGRDVSVVGCVCACVCGLCVCGVCGVGVGGWVCVPGCLSVCVPV